jgi:hypothetical protein
MPARYRAVSWDFPWWPRSSVGRRFSAARDWVAAHFVVPEVISSDWNRFRGN